MRIIFNDYGIQIIKDRDKYYIQYEYGEIATRMETIEISEEDAENAKVSPNEAYRIVIKYQNSMMGHSTNK